ncbi:GNAT family N-acetyltransferase [Dictyobacter kobayashii]|uniref:GNAT family acetyltransferase n=1 Tax=Dictyobacter kobayashii TaxID=2014872 RepID=A0A402AWI5_9CHLR|nr:GNAT family protein [Dictyobacter kobayashii]GCE23510.1 GNAT family acetyltransferase [Dictyobacter kobayashii]
MVLLTTERLKLREFELTDWQDVYAYEADPEVKKWLAYSASSPGECQSNLDFLVEHQHEQNRLIFQLAIVLESEQRLIGTCSLQITNRAVGEAELGYALHSAYWGRGYMSEAVLALLDYGFKTLKFRRIFGACVPDNLSSIGVMQKVGMQKEGWLRENRIIQGRLSDSLIFSILAREWQAI